MPRSTEKISKDEDLRLAKLREEGPKKLDACLQDQIKNMPVLDRIATLAETGRLRFFYETVSEARLEGHSWLRIANAAKGVDTTRDSQDFYRVYLSYCKNNNVEPVKIRKN